jgi:hypothetical protein
LDGPLPKLCPAVVLSRQDGHHSAVALLLKAALIQVRDYRLLGASGFLSCDVWSDFYTMYFIFKTAKIPCGMATIKNKPRVDEQCSNSQIIIVIQITSNLFLIFIMQDYTIYYIDFMLLFVLI